MSKDEEEVAATLYALAGTAPRRVTSLEKKSGSESLYGRQLHSKKLDDSLLSSQGLFRLRMASCIFYDTFVIL